MTELEILKKKTYEIAVNSCDYDIDRRNEATKNYALLLIAQALGGKTEQNQKMG